MTRKFHEWRDEAAQINAAAETNGQNPPIPNYSQLRCSKLDLTSIRRRAMGIINHLVNLTKKALAERETTSESWAWQQDYEQADINQFTEKCSPQKSKLNLNHINIEDLEDGENG